MGSLFRFLGGRPPSMLQTEGGLWWPRGECHLLQKGSWVPHLPGLGNPSWAPPCKYFQKLRCFGTQERRL